MSLLGLHILQTLQTDNIEKLKAYLPFEDFILNLVSKYGLHCVGKSHHIFDNSCFTAAFCLSESHICIHTWAEINTITTDVYLCNYSGDNTNKVKDIAKEITNYFESTIVSKNEIYR